MKRDMDLIREILLRIEEYPNYSPASFVPMEFDGIDEETITYHKELLHEAGFIKVSGPYESLDGRYFSMQNAGKILGLTWEGHEFLDLMKEDTAWNKAKEAMKATGGMAFNVLVKVLVETATKLALGQL